MSFKYRTKDYKNEEGEYSEYLSCDKESILELINFNWTDKRPNGLHVISILNENGESLLLEHFGKDVFDVYFLPKNKGLHFHKKSKQELIYNCVEFFMENNILDLELILNKTNKDNDFIRDEFFFIDHEYKITDKRVSKEMLWLLYAIGSSCSACSFLELPCIFGFATKLKAGQKATACGNMKVRGTSRRNNPVWRINKKLGITPQKFLMLV
ncbi:MAG TPA: hypothetical protein VGQ59_07960 [Cyclobacteriaceae bacterium]|nr:hypothetical protein [Cyclobacteriaceae bacterium]